MRRLEVIPARITAQLALAALQAQDPAPEDVPTDGVLRQRRQFLSMPLSSTATTDSAELKFDEYAHRLTFTVPDSEKCRARPLEMVAKFSESREAAGEWATVIEVPSNYFIQKNYSTAASSPTIGDTIW